MATENEGVQLHEKLNVCADAPRTLREWKRGSRDFSDTAEMIAQEQRKLLFILRALIATDRVSEAHVLAAGKLYDELQETE